MTFLIVSHTPHYQRDNLVYAYGPYVREMNLWCENFDKVVVLAPLHNSKEISDIHLPYQSENIEVQPISSFSLTSAKAILRSFFVIPWVFLQILFRMRQADHIHLRCPGNVGLLGCMAQSFYPSVPKTAKYAGNWDPNATQPYTYRFQKRWLEHPILSRKMQVLVYGNWDVSSKNIVSFFTATYAKTEAETPINKMLSEPFRFLFVGSLSPGKRPLYAIQFVAYLNAEGIPCRLDVYGDGPERETIDVYLEEHHLEPLVTLHGNQTSETVKQAYKASHFLLLPSKSEGWPKVVAEAMFWKTIPLVTPISCVPWMLGQGSRGVLLSLALEKDANEIIRLINDKDTYKIMATGAQDWSRQYTLEAFREAIKRRIQ